MRNVEVDRLLADLDHPLKAGVERLRSAILDSNPDLTEHVKWNAPSFRYRDEDRVTFKLHPTDRVQLILHRGAKVRTSDGFSFEDSTGLVRWRSADRGVLTFYELGAIDASCHEVVRLVNEWVSV
ncbi:MAG TPA: DUF1801 domain-containing protein [Actinomycetales bacterium]|nr:DUF1801 domain-containing protein [Actinomycetales bacterium]